MEEDPPSSLFFTVSGDKVVPGEPDGFFVPPDAAERLRLDRRSSNTLRSCTKWENLENVCNHFSICEVASVIWRERF